MAVPLEQPAIVTIDESGTESSVRITGNLDLTEFTNLHKDHQTTFEWLVDQSIRTYKFSKNIEDDVICTCPLPFALFLVHKWYLSSLELLGHFSERYKSSSPVRACTSAPNVQCKHDSTQCYSYSYRAMLCAALRDWIRLFPIHFDHDSALREQMNVLRCLICENGGDNLGDCLDTSNVPSYAWMRNISVRNPTAKPSLSLCFDQWSSDDLAVNLTHMEHRLLRRIPFEEYRSYAVSCLTSTNTPNLQRSIAFFNCLSQWIQCMILSRPTPKERADIIMKFTDVAKKLKKLHNFNTLMAVIGSVEHTAIARLAKTQACLSPETRKDKHDLAELVSSTTNFSKYRLVLEECKGFKIPIFGVHLKDLISIHSALVDFTDANAQLLNLKKLNILCTVFSRLILDLERISPNITEPNHDLINTLKVSLYIQHSEDDIYKMSTRCEPKSFFITRYPTPTVVAEWAEGVCHESDRETMTQYVNAMVESVFKHYDHDQDDYISRREFEAIASNFPFIDEFVILDQDQDGMLSKHEMIDYFVQVNQKATEALSNKFRHNFHECTFLSLTTCYHCNKTLWGLLRQGMKCKDCGVPVHRSEKCTQAIMIECRKKMQRVGSLKQSELRGNASTSVDAASSTGRINRRLAHTRGNARPRAQRAVSQISPESPVNDSSSNPLYQKVSADEAVTLLSSQYLQANSYDISEKGVQMKKRAYSETTDMYRPQSPGSSIIEPLPSLASEEVFEEENSITSADTNANVTSSFDSHSLLSPHKSADNCDNRCAHQHSVDSLNNGFSGCNIDTSIR